MRNQRVPCLRVVAAALAVLAGAEAARGQVTVFSAPVGVLSGSVARGESGLALPLIGDDLLVGVVQENTEQAVTFPAGTNVGALLSPEGRYYLEVVTGPLEGERLDVDADATLGSDGATVVLALGGDSLSTLPALPAGALAGARAALRPHLTLAALQALLTPGLAGHDQPLRADGVRLLEGGQLRFYYLRADGGTWSRRDSEEDFRHKVIPPDGGFLMEVKSQPQSWVHAGKVRSNAFRKNLSTGLQPFHTGFPMDLSPAQVGAFVDPGAPAGTRWTGHNVFAFADQFQWLFRPGRPFDLLFLRADGSTWRTLTNPANLANQPVLGATDMIVLRRVKPDPAYAVPRPFAP